MGVDLRSIGFYNFKLDLCFLIFHQVALARGILSENSDHQEAMAKDSSINLSFESGTLDGRNSNGDVGPIGDGGRVSGGDDKTATSDIHCQRRPGTTVSDQMSCVCKFVLSPRQHLESLISEGEIKFRLHRCYMGMGQPTNAINVLQTIPSRQRTPACQMALGNLYRRAGRSERSTMFTE